MVSQTHTHTDFADLNVLTHNHCKFRLQALDKLEDIVHALRHQS